MPCTLVLRSGREIHVTEEIDEFDDWLTELDTIFVNRPGQLQVLLRTDDIETVEQRI